MFNIFISFVFVSISGFQILANDNSNLQPSMVVTSSTTQKSEIIKLFNVMNNSAAYATVTSKILNGSGNSAFQPIKMENPISQLLGQLSYFDLYLQRSLIENKVNNLQLGLHLLPQKQEALNVDPVKGVNPNSLSNLVDLVNQTVRSYIKIKSQSELNNPTSLSEIRNNQLLALKERFPVKIYPMSSQPDLIMSNWLIQSFLPISASNQLDLNASTKIFKSIMLFPALGFPTILDKTIHAGIPNQFGIIPMHLTSRSIPQTVKIDSIDSNVAKFTDIVFSPDKGRSSVLNPAEKTEFEQMLKARALKVEIIKDLNQKHKIDFALSFGYLNKNNSDIYSMNVDVPSSHENAVKLNRNIDFALVVKGDMLIDDYAIGNQTIRNKVNEYISSLFDIRLVFHKVYLSLDRLPVSNPRLQSLNLPENSQNLDLFLNNDISYEIKNLKYIPEKSIMNVVISIKPEIKKAIEDGSFFDGKNLIKKTILGSICFGFSLESANAKIPNPQLSECQFSFSSVSDFKTNFVSRFINDKVAQQVGIEVAHSASYQAKVSEKNINEAAEAAILRLMTELQTARKNVMDMVLKK